MDEEFCCRDVHGPLFAVDAYMYVEYLDINMQ